MTSPYIFGTETELAVVVESKGAVRPAPCELASAIVGDVGHRYAHAISVPPLSRLFLTNGACIYADIGGHPEMASAECSNPIDLVSQMLALRKMLTDSAQAVGRVYGIPLRLIANNIDYAFGGAQTFGYHLNVLVTGVTRDWAAAQLAPLLVAMPLITGTGRVSFASGCSGFELSQRAQYMSVLTGKHTTESRAMITVKDEPLSDNGTRIHIICFDTAMSTHQLALVPAIVAMVLKTIESDKDIAGPVALADPVHQWLHTVSRDPSLSAKLPLKRGGSITALGIHEHYINVVGEFLCRTEAPNWTKQMLELWQQIVKNLHKDPFMEVHRLDWVKKLLIFTNQLERVGLTWNEYSKWIDADVLASVRRFKASWPALDPLRLTQTNQGRTMIPRSALGVLERNLANHGLSWKDFPRIWDVSNQLCQQCLRYHILDPDINQDVEKACEWSPLVTKQMVDKARSSPPTGTRATIRGNAIRDAQPGAVADWTFVQQSGKRLVMSDAFGNDASWKELRQDPKKEKK